MAEVALAADKLDVGAVEEAGADSRSEEAVPVLDEVQPEHPVLDEVQPEHEAGRQPGTVDARAVERAEGGSEAISLDQTRAAHQGMAAIDELHRRRAEEFGLLGWRRYGQHRRAPARRRPAGITASERLQPGRGSAGGWPAQ